MHSIKKIFKHKSKSENFLLNDASFSDGDEVENKKKLKELKKNGSKKSNNNILKNLSRHSSRISNIGLENESSEKLKEQSINNDIMRVNNEVNEMHSNNITSPNEQEVNKINHKKSNKELPAIRTLKEIGTSASMPVISPSKMNPYESEDEESNVTQKSKKELKKEKRKEEKKKKKELKEMKKKEKRDKKMQENLEKGEFYAMNNDKKKKDIKKEYKKFKKNNKDKSVFDVDNNSETLSPSSTISKLSEKQNVDSECNKNNNIPQITVTCEKENEIIQPQSNSNETKNNENLITSTENKANSDTQIKDENKNFVENKEENNKENDDENNKNIENSDTIENDENIKEKEKEKEKENENENENDENNNDNIENNNNNDNNDNVHNNNENNSNESNNNENKENESGNKENVNNENINNDASNKENKEETNEMSEKKKQEIEEIEDDLPLAILRYKNPQSNEEENIKNSKDDENDEDKLLYVVKLKYDNRRSTAGNEMRKSVSASDLLSRVRRSMALRNSGYFNTGNSYSDPNNRINMPKCRSFNGLQPIDDDDDDDLSLAAVKEKRSSLLVQLNELNINHPINSYNKNTFRQSGMRTSLSSGCLNINNHSLHNSLMVGPMNGAPVNGAPINGAPINGAPMNGAPMNGAPINGIPINGIPINGMPRNGISPLNGIPINEIQKNSPGHSPLHSPRMRTIAPEMGGKRQSMVNNNILKNSKSSISFSEFNKNMKEQEVQRKRQSIIESNKRRSQIMMNGFLPSDRLKSSSNNSIESGNSSNSSVKKQNSSEKINKIGNCGKIYENEIQEYPGQKFVTFTPLEYNTFPATASVRVIPGQSKRDKVQRRSLAVEVQAPKESFIPIETKENNYMQIESLRYKKQKRKEHQEYEDKITSWINNSAAPTQPSQTKKI